MKATPARDDKVNFDTVLELGALLPGVEATSNKQRVALKLKGRLVACTAINRSAEPDSLMICLDFPARDALLEQQPDTYYMTPHYRGYATVLVRLPKIGRAKLSTLLARATQFVDASTKKPAKKKAAQATARKTVKKATSNTAHKTTNKTSKKKAALKASGQT